MGLGDMLGIGGSVGSIINDAPAAIPGIGQYLGAQDTNAANTANTAATNAANQASANASMAFQAQQTNQQEAYQTQMSDTAVQRQVADMKAAGINPLMAATGGASSPSGASGGGAQATNVAPKLINPAEGVAQGIVSAVGTALDAAKVNSQLEVNKAQIDNLDANTSKQETETEKTQGQVPEEQFSGRVWKMLNDVLDQTGQSNAQRNRKSIQQFNKMAPQSPIDLREAD